MASSGHRSISPNFRTLGWQLLAAIGCLIALVVMLRHAGGEELVPKDELALPNQVNNAASLQTTNPSETATQRVPSLDQSLPPHADNNVPIDDPIMKEIQKLAQDPASGLQIPQLDSSSPLQKHDAKRKETLVDEIERQRLRCESISRLTEACITLLDEASAAAEQGKSQEADKLNQKVGEIRRVLTSLLTD